MATTVSSKPQRKGLAVALASVLLIACGVLGYLFLGDDGDETTETSTATFTPGKPWTVPTASIEMIWCESGTFMMGSLESEVGREVGFAGKKKYDETQHQVKLTKGFYLGKYEVTQAQWEKVMGTSPSKFNGEERPVEMVSWTSSKDFCWKLTLIERKAGRLSDGWEYTLPTEAQWEYACRAGTITATSFGNSLSSKQANFDGTKTSGGASAGSKLEKTMEVGSYPPNAWGFFDMHGNVWEWCSDWIGNYPMGSLTDPEGAASGSNRVRRGGSWTYFYPAVRSAGRHYTTPDTRNDTLGFRLSLQQVKVEQPNLPVPGKPWTVPTVSLDMLWCEPGTFMMGSPENEKGRSTYENQHQVTLSNGFYLGKHEVTQAQWKKVMGTSPSEFQGDERPVEKVSWNDAIGFCQKLTLSERKAGRLPDGWEYTLPTEAQWEFACRADTSTATVFGDNLSSYQANFNGTYPQVSGVSSRPPGLNLEVTTAVGSYQPNAWSFHDMYGNVSEWCVDRNGTYAAYAQTDPTGPLTGKFRVQRGGSWATSLQVTTRKPQPAPVSAPKAKVESAERYVMIASKEGQVTILGANDKPLPADEAAVGGHVPEGATIVTGAKGRVILLFSNGAVTTVPENAKFKVTLSAATKEKAQEPSLSTTEINLDIEDIVFDIKKLPSFDISSHIGPPSSLPPPLPLPPIRSAQRSASKPDDRSSTLGFRLSLQQAHDPKLLNDQRKLVPGAAGIRG